MTRIKAGERMVIRSTDEEVVVLRIEPGSGWRVRRDDGAEKIVPDDALRDVSAQATRLEHMLQVAASDERRRIVAGLRSQWPDAAAWVAREFGDA